MKKIKVWNEEEWKWVESDATHFSYDLSSLDYLDEGSGYLDWSITAPIQFTIYTNTAGEGLFLWDEHKANYHQEAGTCQFRMPRSKSAIRKELRRLYGEFCDPGCHDNPYD